MVLTPDERRLSRNASMRKYYRKRKGPPKTPYTEAEKKDRHRDATHRYYQRHKEERIKARMEYHWTHREVSNAYARKYMKENRERYREYRRRAEVKKVMYDRNRNKKHEHKRPIYKAKELMHNTTDIIPYGGLYDEQGNYIGPKAINRLFDDISGEESQWT